MVYWNRPVPTKQIYSDNINILIELIRVIEPFLRKRIKENIVHNLWIDKSIQKDIDWNKVEKIKNNFDINKFKTINCVKSLNEDRYYIIDGKHRAMAMKLLNIDKKTFESKLYIQNEAIIEDTYMSDNPILVDEEIGV